MSWILLDRNDIMTFKQKVPQTKQRADKGNLKDAFEMENNFQKSASTALAGYLITFSNGVNPEQ